MTTVDAAAAPIPDEWRPGIDALRALPNGALALLIGATDRGKTTFASLAARCLAAEFDRVAIIDTDIGQSEIGPPGTVGVGWALPDAKRLHELKPSAVFFVGAFAPNVAGLELVVAAAQAASWARKAVAGRILVDTTGFVSGPAARRLKIAKALAVTPTLIIGLGRDNEIGALLAAMGAVSGAETLMLAVPDAVGRKAPTLRATRRLTRLSQALLHAREFTLPLGDGSITTVGAILGTGEPMAPHLTRWAASTLRLPVVYAERSETTLTIFVSSPTVRNGWEADAGPVAQHFGARTTRALALPMYANAYVGLHDRDGRLLTVGRFVGIQPETSEIIVSAPPPATAERTRLIQFGRLRVGADGSSLSDIKPGEI